MILTGVTQTSVVSSKSHQFECSVKVRILEYMGTMAAKNSDSVL